jgi:hypothetical protein
VGRDPDDVLAVPLGRGGDEPLGELRDVLGSGAQRRQSRPPQWK